MNDALRDEIIAEITAAFSGVRRGEITLHEADVIDDCGSDTARRAAHARDTEKRWQDVPDADIESYSAILCFVCPESFRYYIAAYVVWSLRNYRSSRSITSDWTIYALAPNTNKDLDERKLTRFNMFSAEQARAIRLFLEYMVEHGDGHVDATVAKLGLEVYWNKRGAAATNQL
jgi:hypothetical protein